jgi:hypothetical protein
MAISNSTGAQSIIKAGVCTSATRPASPYDGQVIYETDTDRTLVFNGTGWVFLSTSRANPNGMDLIKTQTIGSAVSSVTVSDVFSNTYDAYKITIAGGAGSSANTGIRMTMGSTATGYYFGIPLAIYSGGAYASLLGSNATSWEVGSVNVASLNLNMELIDPFATKTTKMFTKVAKDTSGGSGSGFLDNTISYTAFTLTPSAGTLTGGIISVYGYAK